MKKIIILINFLLLHSVSIMAAGKEIQAQNDNSPTTVRLDRVWEYDLEIDKYGVITHTITHSRFHEPVIREGVSYHPLVCDENGDTLALMREENGRVYRYFEPGTFREGYAEGSDNNERLLYDFNKTSSESFDSFGEAYDDYYPLEFRVNESGSITGRNGLPLKYQSVVMLVNGHGIGEFDIIEGFGLTYCSFMHEPYYPVQKVSGSGLELKNTLCVRDIDGNVIYPLDYHEYKPMLVDGRRWDYFHDGLFGTQWYKTSRIIDGKRTVDGVEYSVVKDAGTKEAVAYLREANGRIYRYVSEPDDTWLIGCEEKEILLYDFTLQSGGEYCIPYTDQTGHTSGIRVKISSVENIDSFGTTLKKQLWDVPEVPGLTDYYAIESLGICNGGTLENIFFGPFATNGDGNTMLVRAVDPDGTLLYLNKYAENAEKLYDQVLSADDVEIIPEAGNGKIYDLMGREIRDPQPGTVYIRNGKKYVRSTK